VPKKISEQNELVFRNAKPGKTAKRVSDGKGLFLLVGIDGSKKWRFQYSRPSGGRNTLSFGDYPTISTAAARKARDEALAQLQQGIDPSELKKITKAAQKTAAKNTFGEVAREWFIKEKASWTDGHAKHTLARIERNLIPWLGSRPIGEISTKDVLAVLKRIDDAGHVATAHRALGDCGRIFMYAVITERAQSNPCTGLNMALKSAQPKTFAALTEPKELGELLRVIEGHRGGLVARCALRLAPHVFVRPGELRQARWVDIDLDAAQWAYSVGKTKKTGVSEHIVPLSRQAVAILRELHPLTGDGEFVFPANRGIGRPMSENTLSAALRSLGYDGQTATAHGFRATARTLLDEVLEYPAHLIEHQLAHQVKDANGVSYNRTKHLPQRRAMMQHWSDYLESLRDRKPIPKRKKTD
jgi:integrase